MAAEPLATLIGRNARRIRSDANLTLDRVASEVSALGHAWSHSCEECGADWPCDTAKLVYAEGDL